MKMTPAKSASIKAHGYDPETKTMAIEFATGKGHVYQYADVPQNVYDALCGAKSIGAYFHTNVAGKYDHIKVAPMEPDGPAIERGTLTTSETKEQTDGVA